MKWYVLDDGKYERYVNKPYIEKHSFNIPDLIEVGDYVNGSKVVKILNEEENKILILECGGYCKLYDNEIKSIVTKEAFANAEYRVEIN